MTVNPESVEFVNAVRTRLAAHGLVSASAEITLAAYEAVFPRREKFSRRHFRVQEDGENICHLIVGANLAPVHLQAGKFFEACPKLICRPLLFWEEPDGTGHLCLEHFAGESLDDAVLAGRCSEAQWTSSIRRAQQLLAGSQQTSDRTKLESEIRELVEKACSFPGLSGIDTLLLRELAGSVLMAKAPSEDLFTRWSNADFIGRNLLIDPSGDLRLIDYEHAGPTHFWASDWLRLIRFSNLPPGLDQKSIPELAPDHRCWHEVQLWLQNLAQLREAETTEAVVHHTASVVRLLFEAIGRLAGRDLSDPHRSFLLTILGGHRPNETGKWAESGDRKSRESILAADLEQAQYRLLALNRQLIQQEAMYAVAQGAKETQRSAKESLETEISRLRRELHRAQQYVDRRLNNSDGQTTAGKFGIDQIGPLNSADGKFSLSGWIIGARPRLRKVRLRLDGGQIFDCQTAIPRPDVAAAYPDDPGNLSSGFSVETQIPAGFHIGTIEQREVTGDWVALTSLSLVAGISPIIARLEMPIPPRPPAGRCQINGWCFHPQIEVESLCVRFGTMIAPLTYGILRPDIGASYPGIAAAERSGFTGIIQLGSGKGDIVMIATLRDGSRLETVIARDIFVPHEALERATRDLLVPEPEAQKTEPTATREINSPLDFGQTQNSGVVLQGGWSESEGGFRWAIGPRAGLKFLFSSAERPRRLRILLCPFIVPGKLDRQRININFPSGTTPDTIELTQGIHQELIIELSPLPPRSKVFHLQFGFPDACRPKDLGLSEDTRLLSVGFFEFTLS
jgi:hypothetical protein